MWKIYAFYLFMAMFSLVGLVLGALVIKSVYMSKSRFMRLHASFLQSKCRVSGSYGTSSRASFPNDSGSFGVWNY